MRVMLELELRISVSVSFDFVYRKEKYESDITKMK